MRNAQHTDRGSVHDTQVWPPHSAQLRHVECNPGGKQEGGIALQLFQVRACSKARTALPSLGVPSIAYSNSPSGVTSSSTSSCCLPCGLA